ncbi:hypothetical protein CANCADRAFT_14848, partial [Tortispora caseinolytica NRRL Y-17796]
WTELDGKVPEWLVKRLMFMFADMTPVQAATIPLFCGNKDVVVEAVTGSGKTIGFLVPVIDKVTRLLNEYKPHFINAIVLSPTKELAAQTMKVLEGLLEHQPEDNPIRTQLLIGGNSSLNNDRKEFVSIKPHILVGTPGRMLDLLDSGVVKTSKLDILILDEADRLLDLGFDTSINSIISKLPKQRRTGLFSATASDAVNQLIRVGLRYPVRISVKVNGPNGEEHSIPPTLDLQYSVVEPDMKLPYTIRRLEKIDEFEKAIVYFPTCVSVMYYYSLLKDIYTGPLSFISLHGKLSTAIRKRALAQFAETDEPRTVLLTTDVAARGLDIPQVDVVVQLDPPTQTSMFVHRMGRAARAGRYGRGILLLNKGPEVDYLDLLGVRRIEPKEDTTIPLGKLAKMTAKFNKIVIDWVLEDRDRHDRAVQAYVSYVRSYTKHTASTVFRVKEIDFLSLARAHGLIRLPSMPELKGNSTVPTEGWLVKDFNMHTYKYLDEKKEAQRLAAENSKTRKSELKNKKAKSVAWSEQTEKKESKEKRREKKKRRLEAISAASGNADLSDEDDFAKDWKELVSEKKEKK